MVTVEPIRDRRAIERIKSVLRDSSPRNYLLFVLGINTHLRIGDLLNLKVRNVRDSEGEIKNSIYLREEKTNREVKPAINESAKEALEFFFDESNHLNQETYLFRRGKKNQPLTRQRVWQLIKEWTLMVGLKGEFGCHSLRKTKGYQARMKGFSIELIQEMYGHRSPEVTRRYIGITRDEIRDVELKVNL